MVESLWQNQNIVSGKICCCWVISILWEPQMKFHLSPLCGGVGRHLRDWCFKSWANQTKPIYMTNQENIMFLWFGGTKRRRDHFCQLKVTTHCCSGKSWYCQRNRFVNCRRLGFLRHGSKAKITDISERFLDITITRHLLLLMLSLRIYEDWILRNGVVMV